MKRFAWAGCRVAQPCTHGTECGNELAPKACRGSEPWGPKQYPPPGPKSGAPLEGSGVKQRPPNPRALR